MLLVCFSVEAVFLPVGLGRIHWALHLTEHPYSYLKQPYFARVSLRHPLPVQLPLLVCVISPAASVKPSLSRAGQELYNQVSPGV